jgi:hypothetical protein
LATLLLVAFAYQYVTMQRTLDAAVAGGWLGLAILTRIVALPLIVIAPVLAAGRSRRQAVTVAGVAVLVLAPYAIRNYALSGAIMPQRSGINLFTANSEYSAGVVADYGPDVLHPYAQARLAREGLADLPLTPEAERQWDTAFRRMALSEIRRHPVDTLQLKARNLFTFFSPLLVPHRIASADAQIRLGEGGQSVVLDSIARPVSQQITYSLSYTTVVVLAIVGFWKRRHDLARDGILWGILLTYTAVHVVFSPSTRYRAPVDFVFLFYAAIGVDALSERMAQRNARTPGPPPLQNG